MPDPSPHEHGDPRVQSPASQISNRMVQITRDYTGRGPTRARTYIQDDHVLCVLRDTLTKGEQALANRGETSEVIRLRRTYQGLMRSDATAAVEEITGRRVVAFLSDHTTEPDVAAELFLLEPAVAPEAETVTSSSTASG